MDEDTLIEVEGRTSVNPQKGLQERLEFIDTLRDVQAQNTAQVNQNTYNLGTQVPSNVGGLGGAERLIEAQYVNPQAQAQVANLKAVATETARNQMLANLEAYTQNQYNQAKRGYYARAKAKADAAGNGNGDPTDLPKGDDDLLFDGDEMVTPGPLSTSAQQSLNKVTEIYQNTMSGLTPWAGYNPNLSYQENMINYMAALAQRNKK